jgi:hypothetical protein
MSDILEYIFSLDTSERQVLNATIQLADELIAGNNGSVEGLAERMQEHRRDNIKPQEYNCEKVNNMIRTIFDILQDDTMVQNLIWRLNDYRDSTLATTLLGWFGKRAHLALSPLVSIASGTGPAVELAKQAILRIGDVRLEIMQALRVSLSACADHEFRELSSLMIRAGYASSVDFANLITEAAMSENADIREATACTIQNLESSVKQQLLPVLDHLKNDPIEYVRQAAIDADI